MLQGAGHRRLGRASSNRYEVTAATSARLCIGPGRRARLRFSTRCCKVCVPAIRHLTFMASTDDRASLQSEPLTAEEARLIAARKGEAPWRYWGPYLSERQWGTVREDYSEYGTAWEYLPHDHARSRAYRWGEDGIAGICDDRQRLCFALALWNGADPILKERMFGLTGNEGNHGEDVKEYYFY